MNQRNLTRGRLKRLVLPFALAAAAFLAAAADARDMVRISNPEQPKDYYEAIVVRFDNAPLRPALREIYRWMYNEYGVRLAAEPDDAETLSIDHQGSPTELAATLDELLDERGWERVVNPGAPDVIQRQR
ncbi:MAG: hypothetical protein ISN26_02520 [Betaproteobacteria bacterium AqS2]|uniref:Uncharacterized protein n=1 Tax=Candidatus Amphirhobacter heronislandensis TaxID=1732024 RepID=A0A930UE82_9GAMM|nr:hypothetical protein [Betaproteobacteria bacterium AqS2]